MNVSTDLIEYVDDRPGHDVRYGLNSSKIHNELNWKPCVKFGDGITKTIDWYLSNNDWWKDIPTNTFGFTPWKN